MPFTTTTNNSYIVTHHQINHRCHHYCYMFKVIHPHHQSNHHRHHRHHYCQVVFLLLQSAVSSECQNLLETFDLALVKHGLQVTDIWLFIGFQHFLVEFHLKVFPKAQNVLRKRNMFQKAQYLLWGIACFRRSKNVSGSKKNSGKNKMFQKAQNVSGGTKFFMRHKIFQEAQHVSGST